MITGFAAVVERALEAAVRAPSPHNTQPWRFAVDGARVDVLLDRSRVLPVADPDGRQARMACGAAALNLTVSLRAAGLAVAVRAPGLHGALASVRITGRSEPDERDLARCIARRHTNRRPFLDREVPRPVRTRLADAAADEGAVLHLVADWGRYDRIAALVREADHVQATDERFRAETRRWTGRPPGAADGVPATAAGPPPSLQPALALRAYAGQDRLPARDFEQQPLLGVLLTRTDGPVQQVRAGFALQRVLLTATLLGLGVSFLSQPLEVPATHTRLRGLFDDGEPQTVLRIGYGFPVPHAGRRPPDEVLSHE